MEDKPAATINRRPSPEAVSIVIGRLKERFGDRAQTGESIQNQHANTQTWIANEPPDVVVFPESTAEVQEIIRLANEHDLPIIPFGAGTSLEGQVNAPFGGVSVDLSRMNRLLAVNERDLDCVVEAGISRLTLNQMLRDTGLFFPVDPGAESATMGGMASTRASGTNAVRYGTMRENVLNLTAVLADGSVVKTANRARKSASGYDLTHLLIGTEGTLGVITELTLRLFGAPEVVRAATCQFGALEGACNAVIQAIQLGLGVARIELLDEAQIHAINFHSKLTLPEAPTLILEFHGNEVTTRNAVEQFQEIASSEGAIGYQWAESEQDRRRLWKARHDAYFAVKSTWPGKDTLVTDVCVPISRLAECVVETQADIKAHGLTAPIVGHVGDGNFHCCVVFDPETQSEREAVELFLERLSKRALAMDGTCTGEHGVGQGKVHYMVPEHGARGVQLMRQIKAAMDPKNILNPGKIFPAQGQS